MFKRLVELAFLAIAVAALGGCSDSSTGPSSGGSALFPLAEGNSWDYVSRYVAILPSAATRVVVDTLDAEYFLEIAQQETLQDTLVCYKFVETAVYDSLDSWSSSSYYDGKEDGLWSVAYETGGGIGVSPKPVSGRCLSFRGQPLSSVRQALLNLGWGSFGSSRPESLIFEDPPVRSLAYPLRVGLQWTYREPGAPWAIDKRVTGYDSVTVPAGTYRCYAVKWLIDIWDDDGQWDEDIDWVDHYCFSGLVKRTLIFRDCVITDEHATPIDTLDIWEEHLLASADIE